MSVRAFSAQEQLSEQFTINAIILSDENFSSRRRDRAQCSQDGDPGLGKSTLNGRPSNNLQVESSRHAAFLRVK